MRGPLPLAAAVSPADGAGPGAAAPASGAPPHVAGSLEPPLRGQGLLRALERPFLALERLAARALPEDLDPLAQTGAVANVLLIVALVTGVLLLFWYSASVHQAHASVEAMGQAPWTAGLVRSLHRYSSDACMFFVLLHAARLFVARRIAGARWLAWVTGVSLLGFLWVIGWLGYWLVWDERARQLALGTAVVLDALPIFTDPQSRSFLTDGSVNSLLFFVVFFLHMLVPLLMGVALWLHIARLARSRFLTTVRMAAVICAWLVAISLLHPATSAAPARMTAVPAGFTMDAWYLLPIALTDRLGAGALWGLGLAGTALLVGMPWLLARGRAPVAVVEASKCNACTRCVQDCPYDAISMVAGEGGKLVARVDPARCVGCSICSGSCDPAAIALPGLEVPPERRRIESWLATALAGGAPADVAIVCGESAGAGLTIDPATGQSPELPGYRVLRVPCAGWVHMLTLERALRRGAGRALVVACPCGTARHREGPRWVRERLEGERAPWLRADKVSPERIAVLELDRGRTDELTRAAAERRRERVPAGGLRRALVGGGLAVALGLAVVAGSELPYAPPRLAQPELVVSFKHPGETSDVVHRLTPEEKAALPPHMRQDVRRERRRAPVRLRVTIDGAVALEREYPPQGLWGDGSSVAVEHLPLAAGSHRVEVEIGDTNDPAVWPHRAARTVASREGERRVVLFDRAAGFTWE